MIFVRPLSPWMSFRSDFGQAQLFCQEPKQLLIRFAFDVRRSHTDSQRIAVNAGNLGP
jgi:hypothetical protein